MVVGALVLAAGWAAITMSQTEIGAEREVEAIVGLREAPDNTSSEIVILVLNSCDNEVEATVTVLETPDQIEVNGQFPEPCIVSHWIGAEFMTLQLESPVDGRRIIDAATSEPIQLAPLG